ncbi:YhgE/Pip domain-containing protein [Bombilactobacillus folatiphilus]|uniref:YhgE/Pip domain-containing protein n=1 Tax=Bombilactobacillus folatiphilus TaxID=2923362 RepID=A0ABY4P977_9LACO|nr:YhgE/Pip domain-containing protein [Bombilactobacillus folatiphilus]UQS82177.1 YhgE/Pip domain-containing protein [Bombilactobacillus folatiphilus]
MIKKEFQFIKHNRLILISLIAIAFIPFLYSIFFLRSVWDPYGHTGDLPVAVVNQDQAVKYEGKKLAVGKQLTKKLKSNHDLGWRFVSPQVAQKGLKDRKYYTVITIPRNFSKNAATALNKKPKQMQLKYETNGSLNYIGQVVSKMGVDQLNTQIRSSVTQAYAQAMFEALHVVSHGMKQAGDGAAQLNTGTVALNDGLNRYTAAISQVDNGVQSLNLSVAPLTSGLAQLQQQVQPLGSGVGQLTTGADQLSNGLTQLQNAVSASASGSQQAQLQQVVAALPQINTGLQQLNQSLQASQNLLGGLTNLQMSLSNVGAQTQTIGANLTQAQQTLANLQATGGTTGANSSDVVGQVNQALANQGLTQLTPEQQSVLAQVMQQTAAQNSTNEDVTTALQSVAGNLQTAGTATQAISGNLQQIQQVQPQLQQIQGQIGQLQSSVSQLAQASNVALPGASQAITQLNSGVQGIQGALNGTGTQTGLTSGANQLATGLSQLNQSVPTLMNGINQLSAGGQQLGSGVGQLASATEQLNATGPSLTAGSQQLLGGTQQLSQSLQDGAKQLGSIKPTKRNTKMIAEPSKVKHKEYSHVADYGHALAPYVLSLALYVGSIVFNFAYPIRKVAEKGKPAWQWFLSKVTVGGIVAVAMAIVEAGLMLIGGIQPDNLAQYFTTAIIFSLSSMYLIMLLSMLFDNPGRFVAMVLLMLQLGGSGGTFPMQLTSHFYNVIHPYLPMTYSIDAFREAITSGLGNEVFGQAMLILLALIIVCLILLYFSMDFLQKKHLDGKSQLDDNQELQAVEE